MRTPLRTPSLIRHTFKYLWCVAPGTIIRYFRVPILGDEDDSELFSDREHLDRGASEFYQIHSVTFAGTRSFHRSEGVVDAP